MIGNHNDGDKYGGADNVNVASSEVQHGMKPSVVRRTGAFRSRQASLPSALPTVLQLDLAWEVTP